MFNSATNGCIVAARTMSQSTTEKRHFQDSIDRKVAFQFKEIKNEEKLFIRNVEAASNSRSFKKKKAKVSIDVRKEEKFRKSWKTKFFADLKTIAPPMSNEINIVAYQSAYACMRTDR